MIALSSMDLFFIKLPAILLAVAPILVMLAIAVKRDQRVCLSLSVGLLIFALWSCAYAAGRGSIDVTPLLRIDGFALFYTGLAVFAGICVLLLGAPYISRREGNPEEYYVLILTAVAGASAMAASTHFASFYLGLEVLTVSQYGLIGYIRRDKRGTEAAVKYLVLAAASAAFLLMGMAFIYAEFGTMQFSEMAQLMPRHLDNSVLQLGLALFAVGLAFKLSLVPFHLWTPDVYQGSPAPVTAFISTVGKTSMLALMIRFLAIDQAIVSPSLITCLGVLAAASMILGNLLALPQDNLKRLLAYSSIAHMGYVMTAFIALGPEASTAVAFYAFAYTAAGLASWGVIIVLSARAGSESDIERIEDYRGLVRTHPLLGIVLVLAMLSLAGIPLTGGFVGKLLILSAAAGAHSMGALLLIILAATSAIGAYYYLRVVVVVLSPAQNADLPRVRYSELAAATLVALAILAILPGVAPNTLLEMIRSIYPI